MDQLCMPMPSYIQCGWVTEVRARTGNIKSISLMVACIQGSDAGQKCFKISRIFNFGVQLWLTRIRFDLVTAQVDHPIILESTLNDSALYLSAVWRFGRLMDPFRIGHFDRKLPDFNEIVPKFDRLLWISCACPCLHIYSVDRWRKLGHAQEI